MSSDEKFVVIGDIHGCSLTLQQLLAQMSEFTDRTFIFLGDYVDRGPNSKGVIEQLIEFSRTVRCVMLRGNHEQMMLDALEGDELPIWFSNGGKSTHNSYLNDRNKFDLPYNHLHFLRNTRLYYDTPKYLFVHAGIDPEYTIARSLKDKSEHIHFMWNREHLKTSKNKWEKIVVFGHTPFREVLIKNNMIGIDTGCVYADRPGYGILTALTLPEQHLFQQPCIDY